MKKAKPVLYALIYASCLPVANSSQSSSLDSVKGPYLFKNKTGAESHLLGYITQTLAEHFCAPCVDKLEKLGIDTARYINSKHGQIKYRSYLNSKLFYH